MLTVTDFCRRRGRDSATGGRVSFLLYKLLMIFRMSSYSLYICANTFLLVSLCWNKINPKLICDWYSIILINTFDSYWGSSSIK